MSNREQTESPEPSKRTKALCRKLVFASQETVSTSREVGDLECTEVSASANKTTARRDMSCKALLIGSKPDKDPQNSDDCGHGGDNFIGAAAVDDGDDVGEDDFESTAADDDYDGDDYVGDEGDDNDDDGDDSDGDDNEDYDEDDGGGSDDESGDYNKDFYKPLYPGTKKSFFHYHVNVYQFALRHNLTNRAFSDLLKLVAQFLPSPNSAIKSLVQEHHQPKEYS